MTVKERWQDPEVGVPFIQLLGGPFFFINLKWRWIEQIVGPVHTIVAFFLNEEAIRKAMPAIETPSPATVHYRESAHATLTKGGF